MMDGLVTEFCKLCDLCKMPYLGCQSSDWLSYPTCTEVGEKNEKTGLYTCPIRFPRVSSDSGTNDYPTTQVDQYPEPVYEEVTSVEEAERLLSFPLFALDTETIEVNGISELWSIQVTFTAGCGYFIPIDLWKQGISVTHASVLGIRICKESRVIVHNYLYDVKFIDIPNPIDTMIAAWLLQIPMGLKTLAYVLCGMEMKDYMEYVHPYRRQVARDYLGKANGCRSRYCGVECNCEPWADPPEIKDWEWDNDSGQLIQREKHPHNIDRKINARLLKCMDDPAFDPYKAWYDIDERERAEVEAKCGVMRDAGLHDVPHDEAVYYSSRDPDATWRVCQKLMPMIREAGMVELFKMEMAMLPVCLEMMQNGMAVDVDKLHALSEKCIVLMQEQSEICKDIAGYGFNPNSHDQVRQLVYEELGYEVTKKTKKSKKASTNDKQLSKIDHPVIKPILEYRKILKVRSSYAEKLPRYLVRSMDIAYAVVQPTIKLAGTDTGRLKVTDPPLQTIPVRTELGREVRDAFIARPGKQLLFVDLSQIEMRILAHAASCKNLIGLFNVGGDIHTDTAINVFGVDREEAKQDRYRKPIKNVNFGVVYGISGQGLYDLMVENEVEGWSLRDCQDLIEDYFKLYPEVREYTRSVIEFSYINGYAIDMFGRRCYIPELSSPHQWIREAGERKAGNQPIQGGAAGLLKIGTANLVRERDRQNIPLDLIGQFHDELGGEVPIDDVIPVAMVVIDALCSAVSLSVPVLASASAGYSWANTQELIL